MEMVGIHSPSSVPSASGQSDEDGVPTNRPAGNVSIAASPTQRFVISLVYEGMRVQVQVYEDTPVDADPGGRWFISFGSGEYCTCDCYSDCIPGLCRRIVYYRIHTQ
jgi:hypothetical protein